MSIKINGKEYGFNTDIRLGILEMMEGKDLSIKRIRIILKEILIPVPTSKETFNVKKSKIEPIFRAFGKYMIKETDEFKKKLSI